MRQTVPDGAPPAKGVRSTRVVLRPRWQCTRTVARAVPRAYAIRPLLYSPPEGADHERHPADMTVLTLLAGVSGCLHPGPGHYRDAT